MTSTRAYLELHIAVLLYGLTAIIGELLTLSALPLVWWRVGLASISFVPLVLLWKGRFSLTKQLLLPIVGIGCIVALHWLTFYGSIKLANASVALICFATTSLMTSLLEPWLLHKPIKWFDVGLGALVIPGMLLVVGLINPNYYLGMAVGLLSAFLAALFSTLNKRYVAFVRPVDLAATQMLAAFVFLSVTWPVLRYVDMGKVSYWPSAADWPLLLLLVLGCTTLAYLLTMRSLRILSAFASNLGISLEPVYGILLATIFLDQHEALSAGFYLGAGLIFLAVLAHPLLRRARRRRLAGTPL